MQKAVGYLCIVICTSWLACGDKASDTSNASAQDAANSHGTQGDAAPCVAGATQCTNCVDDDGDGKVDGFDINCTGPADNDERGFSTGIPGDNIDAVDQDCFFDGNSGAGNDGCSIHVCCILGATTVAQCPIGANRFDPASCIAPLAPKCIETCAPATPPGCDCFGCCTVCDGAGCVDIALNPATSPNCTSDTLHDGSQCLTCTKQTTCNTPCGGTSCVLCPGQIEADLPAACGGDAACPTGSLTCDATMPCPSGSFCSFGCCIEPIQ